MKTRWLGYSLLISGFVVLAPPSARTDRDDDDDNFKASLSGSNEVPAISTLARGDFRLSLTAPETFTYRLRYSGLAPVTLFAHIHFGQHDVNGGVSAFLCGGSTKPTPCPNEAGEVSGTIVPADVIGPAGQGIAAGQFDELLKQIRRGDAYVNVHTTPFPGGEIRGQLRGHDD